MHNEFMAIIEPDGAWYIAYCLEIPGANGQGHTPDEARESLAEAIALILEDRREDGLRGVPPEAIRETVMVGRKGKTDDGQQPYCRNTDHRVGRPALP